MPVKEISAGNEVTVNSAVVTIADGTDYIRWR